MGHRFGEWSVVFSCLRQEQVTIRRLICRIRNALGEESSMGHRVGEWSVVFSCLRQEQVTIRRFICRIRNALREEKLDGPQSRRVVDGLKLSSSRARHNSQIYLQN